MLYLVQHKVQLCRTKNCHNWKIRKIYVYIACKYYIVEWLQAIFIWYRYPSLLEINQVA